MATHSKFNPQTAAAGITLATMSPTEHATKKDFVSAPLALQKQSPRIKSAIRRDDTILRLGGDAYISALTWTSDDQQLVAVIDGAGWPEKPEDHYYSSRLFTVRSGPQNATFQDVPDYPDISLWDFLKGGAPYYAMNALALDGHIYQYLSTYNNHSVSAADKDTWGDLNFAGAKLVYSPDEGRTWRNQSGSTPVLQESRQKQSNKNMVFFHEPQGAFSQLSFLQMGKGYQENLDGYVYVYSPNGMSEGTMNELVMFRVPKAQILDRGAYEYFAGLRADGNADWVKDINARRVVHTFPRSWLVPMFTLAWLPSVVYNARLGVYMMVNSSGTNGECKTPKPTYLGFWIAPHPWGPWRQIHEDTAWMPAGDSRARAAAPQIAPKWIAEDGKSFWLVWTDVQQSTSEEVSDPMISAQSPDEFMRLRLRWRQYHPYFAFNTQRVDLVVE